MRLPTICARPMLIATLAVAMLSVAALAKDVANTGTAGPAPPLSASQRSALATKDAVRLAQEARVRSAATAAKTAARVFVGPQRQAGLAPQAATKSGAARAGTTARAADVPDEASLQLLRALMGPERGAGFGIPKPATPPAVATPAKDAHR